MAYASKTRGFRQITVAGVRYRWRLHMHEHGSIITVQSAKASSGQPAQAMLPDHPDPWIHFPTPVPNITVTPALVRRVVERALALGWRPQARVKSLQFTFRTSDHDA